MISMGYLQQYRNGYYSKSMIEKADLAKSFEAIGVIACGFEHEELSSYPRFYHFIKYRIPIKDPTRKRRKSFDSLAVLNLTKDSNMFANISDEEIRYTIQEQILHKNNSRVRKKWGNIRAINTHLIYRMKNFSTKRCISVCNLLIKTGDFH